MPITATQFLDARIKAETDWQDSQAVKSRGYMPAMDTLLAILGQQTARFAPLKDRNNCGSVKVTWENACPVDSTIITGITKVNAMLCAPTGIGSSTTTADYGITKLLQSPGFTITDDQCQNTYDTVELIARGLLADHKSMAEKLCKYILAQLVTFSGANNYLGNGLITQAAGNINKISSYDAVAATMVPYLLRAADSNNMTAPFLLQGDMIYNNLYVDSKQEGTPADRGYMKMWRDLQVTEDFKAFAALSMSTDAFLIDYGSTALVTKYAGSTTQREIVADYYITSVPLMGGIFRDANGEPIMIDLYRRHQMVTVETVGGQTRCVEGDVFTHEMKFDYLLNPVACNNGYTGVIHYKKDATIAPFGVPASYAKIPEFAGQTYQAIA